MSRDLSILTFTSLYPSASRPRYGIFVESRLRRLIQRGGIQARVVAPVPWFPSGARAFGEYGRIGATPRAEVKEGIDVRHPRYLMLPRVGMGLQPAAMARAGLREFESMSRAGASFDLIDAHYLYPDGVAAAEIANAVGLPYVLSARGSDVNVIARLPGPGRMIRSAIERAGAVIAVSDALRRGLLELEMGSDRISVLRNGVDPGLFYPKDKEKARRLLELPPRPTQLVASVGNLVAEKGHDLALRAVASIPGLHIAIVGRGPERAGLERLAGELSITKRVSFLDEMPQARLRSLYSAADALVLASSREGWPNVLLESIACGTPVVAFAVGGVPEILGEGGGILIEAERSATSLAGGITRLLSRPVDQTLVRAHALKFAWEPVLDAQLALYRRVARADAASLAVVARATVEA